MSLGCRPLRSTLLTSTAPGGVASHLLPDLVVKAETDQLTIWR